MIETLEDRIKKVRDGYANQAKFADVDQASYFREFVRRIDAVLEAAPVQPVGFFDDQFEAPISSDDVLQSAAREAGWALSNLVDEIAFEKRQRVVNIINQLSAALSFVKRPEIQMPNSAGNQIRTTQRLGMDEGSDDRSSPLASPSTTA